MNQKENQNQRQTSNTSSTAGRGLSAKHVVLILGAVVIVTVGVVAAIILTRQPAAAPIAANNLPVVNSDNLDNVLNSIHDAVEAGMFETHMNTAWTFKDGKSPSNDAVMGNSQNNNFPFWFEVTVNGEVVYKSDLLPVGTQVKEIILNKDLDAGTYPATVQIHMVDDNNQPIDGNMSLNITITVLE